MILDCPLKLYLFRLLAVAESLKFNPNVSPFLHYQNIADPCDVRAIVT
jgi:hypothetical protein